MSMGFLHSDKVGYSSLRSLHQYLGHTIDSRKMLKFPYGCPSYCESLETGFVTVVSGI